MGRSRRLCRGWGREEGKVQKQHSVWDGFRYKLWQRWQGGAAGSAATSSDSIEANEIHLVDEVKQRQHRN